MTRALGIDYGQKRIGLAISDPLGFSAQGLDTLPNVGRRKSIEAIALLCKQREVTVIVIGLPVNMDGSQGPKAEEVLQLVPELEKACGVPVKTWDERLTSRQADRVMIEGGLSRKRQKETSDRLAAILILQGYLDSVRRS